LGDLSLDANEIGLFYIVPCPLECAVLKAHQFDQGDNPQVNLLSIKQIYPEIMKMLVKQTEPSVKSCSTAMGDSWSIVGGEAAALGIDNYIAVDGVKNVIDILGQLELGKLNTIRFLEVKACPGGCVGGALTVENRFIAQRKVKGVWREKNSTDFSEQPLIKTSWIQENQIYAERAGFNPVFQLDSDLNIALKKIKRIEQLLNVLPGLDCGSCGAPSCKALAEDIVQGAADKLDCVYVLKSEIDKLVGRIRTIVQQEETSVSTDHKRLSYLDTFLTKLNLLDHRTFPLVSKDREQEEVD
jgi:hypothetical protein